MPAEGIAIVAGRGVLPRLIAEDCRRRRIPYRVVVFEGVELDWLEGHPVLREIFEKPGKLFADLRAAACGVVTFAGGMTRPKLRPTRFDLKFLGMAPRLIAGLRAGDDATLRMVAAIFEAEGLRIRAPHEILSDLLVTPGVISRRVPSAADRADVARAAAIVTALGAADVGQGAVVAQGLCLGLESIQGTDAMLDFVAATGAPFRRDPEGGRGVLYKAPKPGQDWRIDLPAIGPETIRRAAAAGLAGIAVRAGGVLMIGREDCLATADAAGLFLLGHEAEEPSGEGA
ncbi:LpxI family protein [Amaricoccus solimangrovi]|uniref:LpxI family protein n=1 Tax=Amaricoccus solimangrovi TaxID=2589815 RepID=A0A501WZ35_9RHOB|nr:UDP-2,3-diacylglucosamine diphosphatase LpxI [Amaricoccus solimangrovi]TPE53565.1 LpxI family protein [Amaricoccus solimangrovi]